MPAPQHSGDILHEKDGWPERSDEIEIRMYQVVAGILHACVVQAMNRESLTGWAAEKEITDCILIEMRLRQAARRHFRDIALFEGRSSTAEIVPVGRTGVLVVLDSELHREARPLRRE